MNEEYVEQDLFGEYPVIPQWSAVIDEIIAKPEDDEDNGQSDFFKDFGDGFI